MRTFGLEDAIRLSPAELVRGASQAQGVSISGLPGTSLVEVRVNGIRRLELRGFPASRMAWLKSLGCFTEIVAFRTRLFLPGDRAAGILAAIQEAN
jgi:hypothetical protein